MTLLLAAKKKDPKVAGFHIEWPKNKHGVHSDVTESTTPIPLGITKETSDANTANFAAYTALGETFPAMRCKVKYRQTVNPPVRQQYRKLYAEYEAALEKSGQCALFLPRAIEVDFHELAVSLLFSFFKSKNGLPTQEDTLFVL